jgi:quercetin dioxygenase-like cupin family protein
LPGAVHEWHSDLETADAPGKTLTVWIGLENTHRDSALRMLSRSHRFGVAAREVRQQLEDAGRPASDDAIVDWARGRDEGCEVVRFDVTDGDAICFDGALWHGSANGSGVARRAIVLQYATPDVPVRIPDFNARTWPVARLETPRPPCVLVKGQAMPDINRIVPAPAPRAATTHPRLTNRVHPLRVPLSLPEGEHFSSVHLFRGSTANVSALGCHASVLAQHRSPHPPHVHDEEEVLLVLAGEVDLLLPDGPSEEHRTRLVVGQLAYYPAGFRHTIETVSAEPATYLMFKWHNETRGGSSSALAHITVTAEAPIPTEPGFHTRVVLNGPTAQLRRLHVHRSVLTPGAGYAPHVDAHDVAIVVLEGAVETLGQRVEPHSVIFHPAGEPHGIRNPDDRPATYLVLELHGSQATPARSSLAELARKITDPSRWTRRLRRESARVRSRLRRR